MHESDLKRLPFAFTQRLSAAGLDSLVLAPLGIDGKVFGMLVAARRRTQGFSSGDCEFLRQLSEHLALALNQAKLYEALQRAYEDLRRTQQNRMQEERLRVLGQMASGIAHDINNALSPAALYLQSVHDQDPALNERSRQQLAVVQRAIDDVANTVSRMREFYRREESALNHVPLELNRVIQHAIELTEARWRNMAQERGAHIEVRRDLATDAPVMLGVDGEVRDALTNLIFNAVDAMLQGGTLTLRSRVLGEDRVSIEVVDTGVGMDEATRQRCLEPFFTTKGQRGTGLGLAMVYGMVVRHFGSIEVHSSPGAGACIRLSFPRAREDQISARRAADASPPSSPQRILVIDDDPVILTALKTVLEGDGHVVVTAEGGEQGVKAFAAAISAGKSFSLVITDLGMPHVDGRQVAAAIKQTSSVPVVLLTGWGHSMQGETIPNIDRILRKPPRVNELRAVLAEFTDSK
ncbi:MAG TPA: ATP-binding protein [Steroidobacteraceae bacterium]